MRDEAPNDAQDVVRALPPLDTDMRAFFAFFGAFSEAPDPLAFLADRGLAEGDIFHLLGLWQTRRSAWAIEAGRRVGEVQRRTAVEQRRRSVMASRIFPGHISRIR